MMKTTRRKLIEYMRVKKVVSAVELARVLKISSADARHHLTSLEEEGVVTVVDTHRQGRGRPTQLFGLTQELNRHNLGDLTSAVLQEWLTNLTKDGDERDASYKRIAKRLLGEYHLPAGNLTQQLNQGIRQLNEMNYIARWEAHINNPRILITHCPYASVLAEHPEVCKIDTFLIEKVLGQPVSCIASPAKNIVGEVQCVFRLVNCP
jgi:predicted ArsR family transcriptional regulator